MNPFSERMAKQSTVQLLEILERRAEYQPLAVEAAEEELRRRNLSATEMRMAREEVVEEKKKKEDKSFVYRTVDKWLQSFFTEIGQGLNIFRGQQGAGSVRTAAVFLSLFVIVSLWADYRWIRSAFKWGDMLQGAFCLFIPAAAGIAAGMLFERRRGGWYLGLWSMTAALGGTFGLLVAVNFLEGDFYTLFDYDYLINRSAWRWGLYFFLPILPLAILARPAVSEQLGLTKRRVATVFSAIIFCVFFFGAIVFLQWRSSDRQAPDSAVPMESKTIERAKGFSPPAAPLPAPAPEEGK